MQSFGVIFCPSLGRGYVEVYRAFGHGGLSLFACCVKLQAISISPSRLVKFRDRVLAITLSIFPCMNLCERSL